MPIICINMKEEDRTFVPQIECPKCNNHTIFTTDNKWIFTIKYFIGGAHIQCHKCGFTEDW